MSLRKRIRILPSLFVAILLCSCVFAFHGSSWFLYLAHAEDRSLDDLDQSLTQLEKNLDATDTSNRAVLQSAGEATLAKIEAAKRMLNKRLREWKQKLDSPSTQVVDIEASRAKIKSRLATWTTVVDVVEIEELKQAVADGLVIAEADGLDVPKLTKIYEDMKRVIRTATFPPPMDNSFAERLLTLNLKTDDRLSTQLSAGFMELIQLEYMAEELDAKARAANQKYRVNLYKRATIAFVRALVSGDLPVPPCSVDNPTHEVKFQGTTLMVPGCPDPVLDNLQAYLSALNTVQSAEIEHLRAMVESVILEQGLITDFINIVPVVSDLLDLYSIYSSEDLAGRCLSPADKAVTVAFFFIPKVGSTLWKQLLKRSPKARFAVRGLSAVIDTLSQETLPALKSFMHDTGISGNQFIARRLGATGERYDQLLELIGKFKNYVYSFEPTVQDRLARERMKTWQQMREAAEDRLWSQHLPPDVLKKAQARSRKLMNANLKVVQGSRASRITASGIVPEHIEALEKLTKERDEIIIVRGVNPAGTERIAAGLKTKPMNIKNKSAEKGPISGLLPVKQELNKQGSRLEDLLERQRAGRLSELEKLEVSELTDALKKGKKSVAECLNNPDKCAKAVAYRLKHPNTDELVNLKVVRDRKSGRHLFVIQGSGNTLLDPESGRLLSVTADGPLEDVLVLAHPDTGELITVDYDLLNVGIKGQHESPVFTPERGYLNKRHNETIPAANEAIAQTYAKKGIPAVEVFHHGAERWYPGSPGAMNIDTVVTVFDPKREVLIIPRCDYECMVRWCRTSKQCDPTLICKTPLGVNCIPPDPNRLLKDYYHFGRLSGYDLGPNQVWENWGSYNGLGGWNMTAYWEELKNKNRVASAMSNLAEETLASRNRVKKFFNTAANELAKSQLLTCKNSWEF